MAKNNYDCIPMMISCTCKTETDSKQREWLRIVEDEVTEFLEVRGNGDQLASFASNGAAIRRRGYHHLFMTRTLDLNHPLHKLLGTLRFMNMNCGRNNVLADIDYKHKFKSKCSNPSPSRLQELTMDLDTATLMRNITGILCMDSHITSQSLRALLEQLSGVDNGKLDSIFDPKDHQNVPKAMTLLVLTARLADELQNKNDLVNRPVILFGKFLGALTAPFTKTSMDLSDQLSSLSTAAHLLFVFYQRNRTSFCPGQLYYDIQTFIKNAFWTTAKIKLMTPKGSFYLFQISDDRLENKFAILRAMANNNNFDLLELEQNISSSVEVTSIFVRHEEWDAGSRRLRFRDDEGVDHLNPKSWQGDVCVESVSLVSSWNEGRRAARKILVDAGVSFSFDSIPDDADLMKPLGNFVGLREDSELESVDGNSVDQAGQSKLLPAAAALTSQHDSEQRFDMSTSTDMGRMGNAPPVGAVAPLAAVVISDVNPGSTVHDIELVDLLPDFESLTGPNRDLDEVIRNGKSWLKVEGAYVHKASAIRWLLCSEDGLKATNRLERVRGLAKIRTYSRSPQAPSVSGDSILGGEIFVIGQAVAAFLSVDKKPALAVLRVSCILDDNQPVSSIPAASLADSSTRKVTIRGQIIKLRPKSSSNEDDDALAGTATRNGSIESWIWNGEYESLFEPVARGTSRKSSIVRDNPMPSKKSAVIELPAPIVHIIKPDLINNEGSPTWCFSHASLKALSAVHWDNVSNAIKELPARSPSSTFPYKDLTGSCY